MTVSNAGADPYQTAYYSTAESYAKELGVTLKLLDPVGDVTKQQNQVQDLIGMNCDAIVLWPTNSESAVAMVKQIKAAGIPVHEHTERISQKQIETLSRQIQTFPVRLKKVRDFSAAQVCTGGIHTEEIHTDTLESRIVPGIYFVGELLDVDGICGGYNLQWAWSSGHVAGSKVGS